MIAVMHNDITQATPSEGSAAWARAFAVIYDPFLWAGERAGVRALRKELLEQGAWVHRGDRRRHRSQPAALPR